MLNTLTTGAMVRLGKTYGNLMVDLQASNAKLVARSRRILQQLTDLDADAAEALLASCGGELKTAIMTSVVATIGERTSARASSVAFVWGLVMFAAMVYWHVEGEQNLSNESYNFV